MRSLGAVHNAIRYLGSRRYRFQHKLARKLIAQIPEGGFRVLQVKHGAAEVNGWDYTKYLTLEHHMQRAARQATTLGLHESRPLRVLDLGCGSGYFLATARYLGHEVLGLDMPGNEMFDDTLSLLNIPQVDQVIESFAPLPELGAPFDLITGHQVWFNWTGRKDPWNIHEWSYFLDDCPLAGRCNYLIQCFDEDVVLIDYRVRGFTRDVRGKKRFISKGDFSRKEQKTIERRIRREMAEIFYARNLPRA
jgi:SAM-dependent methyltransferase